MNNQKRVVVTGLGVICAVASNKDEFARALLDGTTGFAAIRSFDTSRYAVTTGAEVKQEVPDTRNDRVIELALVAAREAVTDAELMATSYDAYNVATVVATSLGGAQSLEEYVFTSAGGAVPDPELMLKLPQSTVAGAIAREFGFLGECATVASACAAGTNSVGYALDLIRYGHCELALAGGVDPFTELSFSGFHALRSLSREVCRPFCTTRDGLVIGEGASFVVLEEYERARLRNARMYAEVLGYGLSNDCYHTTTPHPDGDGAVRSMTMSLSDAQLSIDDIDYVNAHGTATPSNDLMELKALARVFGDRSRGLPVSSIKSMIGHGLGAAGSLEFAACLLCLREQMIPATVSCQDPIPAHPTLGLVSTPRTDPVACVMSNSFAFAGNTATLICKAVT